MIYVADTPLVTLSGTDCRVDAVRLNTGTDYTDTVVEKKASYVFNAYRTGGAVDKTEGNLFIIYDYLINAAYEIVSFAADFEVPSLYIKQGIVYLDKGGFEVEVLKSDIPSAQSTVRKYLSGFVEKRLVAMSNTWGDCNGTTRVCEEFVKREIDAAKELGLDCMQIDDGWQLGSTADVSRRNEKGERVFDGDFWEENTERFPNGLKEIGRYANDKAVKLGIWFAPDYHGCFHHAKRDIDILTKKNSEIGCEFIKLDMLLILCREDKESFVDFCQRLKGLALLELDVTLGKRLGYLLSLKQGIIFVENRYTKFGNYIPSRTLKNIWELGTYLPLQALQAELSNPDLNKEEYSTPFAPCNYTMDYLFATVCFANPLFWLEVQFLSDERKKELSRIMPVWKTVRDEIALCDIQPIGECPTGRSFTGFFACGEKCYAVVFRELTENDSFTYTLNREFTSAEVLAGNCEVTATPASNGISVTFSHKNAYALISLS